MELREWLIILGLALVTLIVVDGVRRLQRQRRVPRLDQAGDEGDGQRDAAQSRARDDAGDDENWELPNGGARVVSPAQYAAVKPKPKLQRQEHPGPSRVLSEHRAAESAPRAEAPPPSSTPSRRPPQSPAAPTAESPAPSAPAAAEAVTTPPPLTALDDEPLMASGDLAAEPAYHDDAEDEAQYRLVDLDGMGDSLKSGSRRMGASMQRFGASVQQRLAERRERKREAQQEAARQAAAAHDAEPSREGEPPAAVTESGAEPGTSHDTSHDDVVRTHPTLARALRNDVNAARARDILSEAEEVVVISVMARDEAGFSGAALLDLMLACGLRYSREMGIFHRFETEDPDSALQFSMVNVLKPGTFPIEAMDDFITPGITLLMPLPGAQDSAAAFEAMVETAMVVVRHLGGELKDENHSVMTAQTVGFARERVQEFERRHRLGRRQVN